MRLRVWSDAEHLVASVHDHGPGPEDPVVGLLPAADAFPGGLGLWIAHQICSHITFHRDEDGFTVRLTSGTPRLEGHPPRTGT